MNQIQTAEDIKKLGTILSVWAHPDDETFTAGGLLAAAVANGQKVVCITATKGEAGVQDEGRWPAARLGEIREKELNNALKELGIKNQHFLGYIDGHCHEIPDQDAVSKLEKYIDKYNPDTVITFGPDGLTGHSDHQTVSKWVSQATKATKIKVYHVVEEQKHYERSMKDADKKFDIFFNIDKPPVLPAAKCDIVFNLPPEILAKKKAALKCMTSQLETWFKTTPEKTLDAMFAQEQFVLA